VKVCIYFVSHGSEDPEAKARGVFRPFDPDGLPKLPARCVEALKISDIAPCRLTVNGLCLTRATVESTAEHEDVLVRFLRVAQGIGRISGYALLG